MSGRWLLSSTLGGRAHRRTGRANTRRCSPSAWRCSIALTVLPSSLNLPQTNPTTTLEYAPVPPDENADAASEGNLSALGLGSSSGIQGGGASGGDGPGGPLPAGSAADSPSTLPVRGNPPRQTEDPLSPPCVAYFDGDNFGATYRASPRDEIRLLVYVDGGIHYINGSGRAPTTSRRRTSTSTSFKPPDPTASEHSSSRAARAGSATSTTATRPTAAVVHFYLYFSGGASPRRREPPGRRRRQLRPGASPSPCSPTPPRAAEDDYLEAMAKKGVLNFGSFAGTRPRVLPAATPS